YETGTRIKTASLFFSRPSFGGAQAATLRRSAACRTLLCANEGENMKCSRQAAAKSQDAACAYPDLLQIFGANKIDNNEAFNIKVVACQLCIRSQEQYFFYRSLAPRFSPSCSFSRVLIKLSIGAVTWNG